MIEPCKIECVLIDLIFEGAWRGIRDEALSQLIGISGCIFVHANGFIGGNKTLEGALEMAKKSLALQ